MGQDWGADISNHLRDLGNEAPGARFRTAWSAIGTDTVVTVTSTSRDGDSMTVRISDDVVLLDINNSNAIEFFGDRADIEALTKIVDACYHNELKLIVGARDERCYGVRVGEVELISSIGLIDAFRSGKRRVRHMR
jgi:hypothetical protein